MASTVKINKCGVLFCVAVITMIVMMYKRSGPVSAPVDGEQLISLKELLSAAVDAAKRGGDEVRRIRTEADALNTQSKGKTKEGVNDPVTDGDMKSHLVMFYSLSKAFPGLKVISEEHDTSSSATIDIAPANTHDPSLERRVPTDSVVRMSDVTVWIDPLDATKEYTENLVEYVTTMVGVAVKGRPTMGVVHRPFSAQTHWAWVGQGASSGLALPSPSAITLPPPAHPRVVVSISHKGAVEGVVERAFGGEAVLQSAAGAGYKVLEVAQNRSDAYLHTTRIKKWDLLAGHAILSAVGGRLTDLDNGELDYSNAEDYACEHGLLATVQHHDWLLGRLKPELKPREEA